MSRAPGNHTPRRSSTRSTARNKVVRSFAYRGAGFLPRGDRKRIQGRPTDAASARLSLARYTLELTDKPGRRRGAGECPAAGGSTPGSRFTGLRKGSPANPRARHGSRFCVTASTATAVAARRRRLVGFERQVSLEERFANAPASFCDRSGQWWCMPMDGPTAGLRRFGPTTRKAAASSYALIG